MTPSKTAADYAAIAVAPLLIFLMISSLANFLMQVFYHGGFPERVSWTLLMFTMGSVAVARVAIENDRAYAMGYAGVLGLVTFVVMLRFVDSPIFCAAILVVIAYLSDVIVRDCTLIDDSVDASGQGLIDSGRLFISKQIQPDSPSTTDNDEIVAEPSKGRKTHQPGRTVMWLALAALPLFGIGQFFLRNDPDTWARAQKLLAFYLFASLSLLVTTSFLGLRRYLRQRQVEMPNDVSIAWLAGGLAMIAAVLMVAYLAPLPGTAIASFEVPAFLDSPGTTTASRHGWGNEGADKSDPSAPSALDPKSEDKEIQSIVPQEGAPEGDVGDGNREQGPTGQQDGGKQQSGGSSDQSKQQGESSSQPGSQGESQQSQQSKQQQSKQQQSSGDDSDQASQQKSQSPQQKSSQQESSQQESSQQESSQQQSSQQKSSQQQSSQQKSSEQSSEQDSSQQQSAQEQSSQQQSSQQRDETDSQRTDPADGDSQSQPGDETDPDQQTPEDEPQQSEEQQSEEQQSEEQQSEEQQEESSDSGLPPEATQPSDSSSSGPSIVQRLANSVPMVASFIKVVIFLVLAGIVLVFLWTNRHLIAEWWARLFGGQSDEEPADSFEDFVESITQVPARAFASFVNPIGKESDPRRIVVITFQAFEAWTREQGTPRGKNETPTEFARRITQSEPQMSTPASQVVDAYNRIVYGRGTATKNDLNAAARVWQLMT